MKTTKIKITELENILHHLNCRLKLHTLYTWIGVPSLFKPDFIYKGYESILNLKTIEEVSEIKEEKKRICIKHGLIDHYLQYQLMPYEAEMRTWMAGAAAHVDGKKIYLREIIPYCQKHSTYLQRRALQKEVSALCKFLRPFVYNYWTMLLELIKEFGFKDYLEYCSQKKGLNYTSFYQKILSILRITDNFYYPLMQQWVKKRYGIPLEGLTRFDAINLLGMQEFDHFAPKDGINIFFGFLKRWGIDVTKLYGLYLDVGFNARKSAQAMSFMVQIPEEIYVVIRPAGGWIDLETIAHELGHGVSAAFTDPDLPLEDRDLATNYILSESFAFLMQNIVLSIPFLTQILRLDKQVAEELYFYKVLKDLSIFRRYAAKFLTEYKMFSCGDISDGSIYSEYMTRYTGFYYQPESHLFDLVPEFYCLDYLIAWITEAILERYLCQKYGFDWMLKKEAADEIKSWWSQGNKYSVFEFLKANNIGKLSIKPILERWENVLCRG